MSIPTAPIPVPELPARVRGWIYFIGWILGSITQGTTVVWVAIAAASPDVTMPVWLIVAAAVLGFVQSQLNALAGANLPSYEDVADGEARPPRGRASYSGRARLRRRTR